MWAWEISSCTTCSSTSAIAPSSNRECATLLRCGLAYFEKHTGECPMSHGQTTGDSCFHEIGMSLIDECTAVDKPLHGWIESDLFALGSRHTRPSIDDRGGNLCILLATGFGQVTPSSHRCWSQQSRISAPDSSCGQTSTARHESCCRNGQPRRWSAPASEELAKGSFRQL